MLEALRRDLRAAMDRDPAARSALDFAFRQALRAVSTESEIS